MGEPEKVKVEKCDYPFFYGSSDKFRCHLPKGHYGKHRCNGKVNFAFSTQKFNLQWEQHK